MRNEKSSKKSNEDELDAHRHYSQEDQDEGAKRNPMLKFVVFDEVQARVLQLGL